MASSSAIEVEDSLLEMIDVDEYVKTKGFTWPDTKKEPDWWKDPVRSDEVFEQVAKIMMNRDRAFNKIYYGWIDQKFWIDGSHTLLIDEDVHKERLSSRNGVHPVDGNSWDYVRKARESISTNGREPTFTNFEDTTILRNGAFVMAPPGSGKSHFVQQCTQKPYNIYVGPIDAITLLATDFKYDATSMRLRSGWPQTVKPTPAIFMPGHAPVRVDWEDYDDSHPSVMNFPWKWRGDDKYEPHHDFELQFNALAMYDPPIGMTCLVSDSQVSSRSGASDWFTEYPRMLCVSKKESPMSYWQRTGDDDIENMWSRAPWCTRFKPEWMIFAIQRIFGDARLDILDPFAGWGDRMIAASSQGHRYTGYDVNGMLRIPLLELAKLFDQDFRPRDFLTHKPDKRYDLVFTSPPFFDREYYGETADSHIKGHTFETWFTSFLVPVMDLMYSSVRYGGYIALHLPDQMIRPIRHYFRKKKCMLTSTLKVGTTKARHTILVFEKW
jgi:hypothetical protein